MTDSHQTVENNKPNGEVDETNSKVRHIPIFVEGRDEPVNVIPSKMEAPQPQTILHSVKNIPIRKISQEYVTPNIDRSQSLGFHNIPIKVEHVQTKQKNSVENNNDINNSNNSNLSSTTKETKNTNSRSATPETQRPKQLDSITKIQQIQNNVMELMKRAENFKGTRNDKEYLYLDEMLTQSLLKLDNIETEGQENIKASRKEAIKCINNCIAILEKKIEQNETELFNKECNDNKQQMLISNHNDKKETEKKSQVVSVNEEPISQNEKPDLKTENIPKSPSVQNDKQ